MGSQVKPRQGRGRFGGQGLEPRMVGIVALNAVERFRFSEIRIPEFILAAMHSQHPFPVYGPVALGAKARGFAGGNLASVVVYVRHAVLGIMAVKAK